MTSLSVDFPRIYRFLRRENMFKKRGEQNW